MQTKNTRLEKEPAKRVRAGSLGATVDKALRKKAEQRLKAEKSGVREVPTMDLNKLVHELRTHQVELEMQNEELRRAQAELEISRGKYAELYDYAPVGYVTLDKNGLIREVNLTGAGMLGMGKRSLIAKPIQHFIEPAGRAAFRDHLAAVFMTQTRQTCELNLRTKKGGLLPVQLQSIVAESGNDSCRTAISDISERKKSEEAQLLTGEWENVRDDAENERRLLASVMEALPTGMAIIDIRGGSVRTNAAYERIWAGPRPAVRSVEDYAAYHAWWIDTGKPLAPEEWASALAVQKGRTVTGQMLRIRRFDGSDAFVINSASPVRDARENIIGCAVAIQDVTDLKQAEDALRRSEQRLRAVYSSMSEGLALHELVYENDKAVDYILTDVNPAFESITGLTRRTAVGSRASLLYGAGEAPYLAIYEKVASTGEPASFETWFPPMNKHFSVSVFSPGKGKFATVFRDITGRKQAEDALRTAHAELERRAYELEAVNRELEAFSYTVSHDLKAPLRSIEGFSGALLEDHASGLDAAGKDCLNRVNAAARRMNQFIEALLNMARLTRGELNAQIVDLSGMARLIAHDLQKQAPDRRVEFALADAVKVRGDRMMLQAALENLMHNAWKFTGHTPDAKIEFGVMHAESGEKTDSAGSELPTTNSRLVYFVRDNGAGFDMRFADKLFMPFHRFHKETEFPGLGIGLAIANRIILRHNGRLWAKSEPGKGATFYFTL